VELNGRDCFDIAAEENLFLVKKSFKVKVKLLNYLKAGSLKGTIVSDSRNVC